LLVGLLLARAPVEGDGVGHSLLEIVRLLDHAALPPRLLSVTAPTRMLDHQERNVQAGAKHSCVAARQYVCWPY
jgi:hypothetical protein